MNRTIIMGRLTRDPEVRYTQGQESMAIARYTLAVDRRGKDKGADFIPCVAFGKAAEHAEKYFKQGMRICVEGHLQSGSYTSREGQKVYTLDLAIDYQEFADSKQEGKAVEKAVESDWMAVPDSVADEGLPFN